MNVKAMRQTVIKKIDLSKLKFRHPPLLVAGMAMMYYGLRESSKDIDLIVSKEDHRNLALHVEDKAKILKGKHQPGYKDPPLLVNLYGDHGILIYEFEIWDTIMKYGYEDLKENAIREKDYLVIDLKKLLFLCIIRGVSKQRYLDDALLIAKKLTEIQYQDYKPNRDKYWENLQQRTSAL